MSDQPISDQPLPDRPAPLPAQPPPPDPNTEFHIGEEFGTAKRNLPPAGIVLICIAAIAVMVGIFAFKERQKPQGSGSINFVAAAEVPGQNMILAAVTFTLGRSQLGYYDNSGHFAVEPGAFDVYVGDSSAGGQHGDLTVTR